MTRKVFIEGMSCEHCARRVEQALKEVSGIKSVKVNLKDNYAEIESENGLDNEDIKAAVDEAGYEVTGIA
ncbi:MAG: heavy-metal-associated domain-containing protein [Acetivibrionales bacterium]